MTRNINPSYTWEKHGEGDYRVFRVDQNGSWRMVAAYDTEKTAESMMGLLLMFSDEEISVKCKPTWEYK